MSLRKHPSSRTTGAFPILGMTVTEINPLKNVLTTNDPAVGATEINPSQLKIVLKNNDPAVVVFYAPWCGHCKTLKKKGELEKCAQIVPVYLLNGDQNPQICGKYNIRGFPTILVKNKQKELINPNCGRSGESMSRAALQAFY